MSEYKNPEVTFKYYLPDNEEDLWLHINASDMYNLIHQIDQTCRSIVKYGDDSIKTKEDLAEKIRDIIHSNIDTNRIS